MAARLEWAAVCPSLFCGLFQEIVMKKFAVAATLGIVALLALAASADDAHKSQAPSREKCAICKNLTDHPELMKSLTWEIHEIDNGLLMLLAVPKDHLKEFQAANANKLKTIERFKAGEEMDRCAFCQGYGELVKAGAKSTRINTALGTITLLTSDKPEVIKQIQAHAKRTIEEQKKLEEHKPAA
jgi:hypothetical protein